MAKLINHKIQGSTLIEVLIAMVIIMIVFGIALKVFGNLLDSGVTFKKVQVQNQLNVLSKEVQKNGLIPAQEQQIDSVLYVYQTDTTAQSEVLRLAIKAKQNGRFLGEVKCLFKATEAHEN